MEAEKPKWATISEAGESKYFSPEVGKAYRIKIKDIELVRKAFQQGSEAKLKARCELLTVDGLASYKVWETGSRSVMSELRKHVIEEKWVGQAITYLLKKKMEGDKVSYIFEELGEAIV